MSDFLTRLAGSALTGMAGRAMGGGVGGMALGAVLGHLMNNQTGAGGISGLVDRFRGAGLGDHAESWVSHGQNQPIAPHELERVFEPGQLDAMSQQTGMDRGGLLGMLSQALPGLVDGMTPHGRLPQHDHEVPQGEGLSGLLGGLLGGGGSPPQSSGTTGGGIAEALRGIGPTRRT